MDAALHLGRSRSGRSDCSAQACDERSALAPDGWQFIAQPAQDEPGIGRLKRRIGCCHSVGPQVDQGFDDAERKIARVPRSCSRAGRGQDGTQFPVQVAQFLPVRQEPCEPAAAGFGQVVQDSEVPSGAAQLRAVIKGDGVKPASRSRLTVGHCSYRAGKRQPGQHGALKQVLEDVVLGLEVVVKRGLPDPHGVGNGPGGSVREAVRREKLGRRIQDFVPGSCSWPGGLLAAGASRSG